MNNKQEIIPKSYASLGHWLFLEIFKNFYIFLISGGISINVKNKKSKLGYLSGEKTKFSQFWSNPTVRTIFITIDCDVVTEETDV